VSIPGVARKTSKGVPRYRSASAPAQERDTLVLSEAEDLVAVQELDGATRYRPRTERRFARIVHHHDGRDDFWEVRRKDGAVSWYGTPGRAGEDPATVAFPEATRRGDVTAWKLIRTEDPFGNRISYSYARDRVADGARRWDCLYPELIQYLDYDDGAETRYLVSVLFEYEDRPDPFSAYRSGFEIRTRRRCRAIHIRVDQDGLIPVRTYRLRYQDERSDEGVEAPLNVCRSNNRLSG
jgi:hypothetical protein